jgi:hypothetical protein
MSLRTRQLRLPHATSLLLLPVILLLAGGEMGCDSGKEKQRRSEEREQRAVEALALKYGARVLPKLPVRVFPYTEEVRRALMPMEGKPVALLASLSDIRKTEKGYVLRFETFGTHFPETIWNLRCDPATAEKLLAVEDAKRPLLCAVAARITDVRRNEKDDLELIWPPFVAIGECLGVADPKDEE